MHDEANISIMSLVSESVSHKHHEPGGGVCVP